MEIEDLPSRLLTEVEAANYLKVSQSTLRQQRMKKRPQSRSVADVRFYQQGVQQ